MTHRKRRTEDQGDAPSASEHHLQALLRSLNTIALSMGAIATRLAPSRPRTDPDRIRLLKGFGFTNIQIAAILDTTPLTVAVRLSEGKKKSRGRNRGKNPR